MRRPATALAACVVALATTLVSCGSDEDSRHNAVAVGGQFEFVAPGGQTDIRYPVEERKQIMDFSGESLTEPEQEIQLSDFAGEVVVLNSWGQWCAPCRAEVDDLQIVHEYMQENGIGTVLGINVRDYNPEISRDFVHDNGVTYPSLYDPPFRTAAALGGIPSSVVPTTVILDKQHRPATVFLRSITHDELKEEVDRIAAES